MPGRGQAEKEIAAGHVLVNGVVADKSARLVAPGDDIHLIADLPRFVGRGGEKLAAALDRFGLIVDGRDALDVGASTGGFTDCLLHMGARTVIALDVGYGQLHPRLRADDRVCVLERTNVRSLDARGLSTAVRRQRSDWQVPDALRLPLVTVDLSFISLRTVLPVVAGDLLDRDGHLLSLVKPQFEAGRSEATKARGVIKDPEIWKRSIHAVASATQDAGTGIMDVMVSPIKGASGNREFFLHARAGAKPLDDAELEQITETVVNKTVARDV